MTHSPASHATAATAAGSPPTSRSPSAARCSHSGSAPQRCAAGLPESTDAAAANTSDARPMTVLVTYASKHGATTEIAEALGRELWARGVRAEVRSADEVDGVSAYDAVVLGSAIYMGKWLPAALELARTCDERRTWLF